MAGREVVVLFEQNNNLVNPVNPENQGKEKTTFAKARVVSV